MRPLTLTAVATTALLAFGPPAAARAADGPVRVAVIVGPVGESLTPTYIEIAERAAAAAEERDAAVVRAYSPNATAAAVVAAVKDANIVIYLGHGVGTPNPYSATPNPATANGWGLNGPNARGDHADSWADGTLAYYGEAWLAANLRPASGFVMIYSNACYAPGAGEGFDAAASEEVGAARVSAYSRGPLADLGASAYFATDFYAGAAELVAALLDRPDAAFADVFATESRYDADAVTRLAHASVPEAETWMQRSAYFGGRVDYWYAFAGNPAATFAGGITSTPNVAPRAAPLPPGPAVPPLQADAGVVVGLASHYPEQAGWEGRATVALPAEIGGGRSEGSRHVLVCADLCVLLPVVDTCPCYVGTANQRVANLSAEAWRQVSTRPLSDGLLPVEIYLEPLSGVDVAGEFEP